MQMQSDPWSTAAIDEHRQWLLAYVLSLTGDPGAADDLVQEIFVIALHKREGFTPGTNFGGWLRAIARNVALMHCKRRGREILLDDQAAIERFDQVSGRAELEDLNPASAGRLAVFLRECLALLSERVRRLLDLRYGQGKSAADVAATVGQSVSAVNVALFRARLTLAECVKRKEGAS